MDKIKEVKTKKYFAYFAPDGEIQVRSIAQTKKMSRRYIAAEGAYKESSMWRQYESNGYVLKPILFSAILL